MAFSSSAMHSGIPPASSSQPSAAFPLRPACPAAAARSRAPGVAHRQRPCRHKDAEDAARRSPSACSAPAAAAASPPRRRGVVPASAAAAAAAAPAAVSIAAMTDTQRAQQAYDWGYEQLGLPLPEGVSMSALAEKLPAEVFRIDVRLVAARLALAAAAIAAGYAWLWYQHSICPLWQQALCWAAIGTGYFGAFAAASDAAHFALWPQEPLLQDVIGATLMAPALWSLEAWRLQYFNHLLRLNMLGEDTDAWHPVTPADLAAMPPWRRVLLRIVLATPLRLLGSLGAWLASWQGCDLRRFAPSQKRWVLLSWAVPAAFAGVAWPAMLAAGGVGGWVSWWLMPWLVFHGWLSLLTLVQHTAPHIPFTPEGLDYDPAQAAINGTVTATLPRWLELLLGDSNYHLPHHLSISIPHYRLRQAHHHLRSMLGPYLTEGPLNLRLLLRLMGTCQVYDPVQRGYVRWEEGEEAAEALQRQWAEQEREEQQQWRRWQEEGQPQREQQQPGAAGGPPEPPSDSRGGSGAAASPTGNGAANGSGSSKSSSTGAGGAQGTAGVDAPGLPLPNGSPLEGDRCSSSQGGALLPHPS